VLLVLEALVLVQPALVLEQLLSFTQTLAIQVVLQELLCLHQPYAMVFQVLKLLFSMYSLLFSLQNMLKYCSHLHKL